MKNKIKNKPWPEEFLGSEEDFTNLLEEEWKNIKQHGLEKGILRKGPGGSLIGLQDPSVLFDSYDDQNI
jgi:hypothetical protein